ncbi:MAG: nucleotidyltransferase domain-containing protein [Candidatus Hydrogenedentes bacterium]|nr:nucleotidyltransferase domain-containing protein [Candidatus Hydrogenedentota bacterium]
MDKETVLRIIERYRQALERKGIPVERIVLYGSFSRGNPHSGSDIDVVIVSPAFEGKPLWTRITMLADALCDVFEPIEAVGKTPQEWESGDSLIVEFAKQGEVVFAA